MRAIVVHRPEDGAHLEDVEIEEPRAGEVLVKLSASGVCGSDLHVLHGRTSVAAFPMVLGHEGAGVVEAVGSGVAGVAVGDHVVCALYGPCGHCLSCRTGDIVNCNGAERMSGMFGRRADGSTPLRQGADAVHPFVGIGSLAEYSLLRESQVVVIDRDLALDVIALAGCGVTTGLGAVFNTARVAPGDHVVVVGCGGVGLNVVQGARLAGAATIVAVDPMRNKLDLATDLGATDAIDASTLDPDDPGALATAVRQIIPAGADVAFEVVGNAALVAATFACTRQGGLCVMVGSPAPGTAIPIDGRLLFMERRLAGCVGGSNVPARDIARIAKLYGSGRLDLDRLVTQRLPMEAFDQAVAAAEAGTVARSVIVM